MTGAGRWSRVLGCMVALAAVALAVRLLLDADEVREIYGCFFLVMVAALVPSWLVLSRAWREPVLLATSIAVAAVLFSPPVAALLVANVCLVYACLRPGRLWGLAFVAWTVVVYVVFVPQILDMSSVFFTQVRRRDVVIGFLFYSTFKRSICAVWETSTGVVENGGFVPFAIYLMGLPFLGPYGVQPSYRHFLESREGDDDTLVTSVQRGVFTCLYCLGALLLVQAFENVGFATGVTPYARQPATVLLYSVLWFLTFYLRRVFAEQGAVGIARVFGYNLRDNFAPDVLLSTSPVAFWRGWNALWREFLVSAFYYPITLRLGRRYGRQARWVLVVGGLATFMAAALFDDIFLLLVFATHFTNDVWTVVVESTVAQLLWGLVVSLNLYRAAGSTGKAPRWLVPLKWAGTLFVVWLLMLYRRNPVAWASGWGFLLGGF